MGSKIRTALFSLVALLAIGLVFAGWWIASDNPEVEVAAELKQAPPAPPAVEEEADDDEEERFERIDVAPFGEALAATMQAEPPPVEDAPPPLGRVEVTVVDERGNPVEGADVRILHPRRSRDHGGVASFNERSPGVFEIEVNAGPARLAVRATGYRLEDPIPITIPANEVVQTRVTLAASASLTGRVVDRETRRPIEGARVKLYGYAAITPVATDSDGRFELSMLPAQLLSLDVRADGYSILQIGGIDGASPQHLELELSPVDGRPGVEVIGVGLRFRRADDGVMVRTVFPGSPAEQVLAVGDVILEADGVALAGMSHRDAVSRIRGPEGTTVELKVQRADGQVERISIERQQFEVRRN